MKRQSYIFLTGLLASFLCWAEQPVNMPSCCSKESPASLSKTNAPALTDASLYQLESTWTNDAGKEVQLRNLQDRPQVVTMFFAHCTYACPILVYDMKRIEQALPAELRSQVGFTLVTIDPERDTVEALKTYRSNHAMGTNWTLLRGNSDDVLELAALLGVKYKKDKNGQFAHSNVVTVLNEKGEIEFQQLGLNQSPAAVVAVLQKLNRGDH